jgi:pyruvate/2-oxoglutarate dehydrogenase complex dihydrolipoamide acyltransferase (E2) component
MAAIVVPDLGSGAEPLLLVQWLVDRGSHVLIGDHVAEVLVAGILFQIDAPASGTVLRFEKGDRSTVCMADVIGWIDRDPD